jgi:hypothetical protein
MNNNPMCEDAPCCGCCGVTPGETEFDPSEQFEAEEIVRFEDSEPNDCMDGDFDSAMASAGFGTDEDYGFFGGDGE